MCVCARKCMFMSVSENTEIAERENVFIFILCLSQDFFFFNGLGGQTRKQVNQKTDKVFHMDVCQVFNRQKGWGGGGGGCI